MNLRQLLLAAVLAASSAVHAQPFRFERLNVESDLKANGEFVQFTEQQVRIQDQTGLQQAGQMVFVYNVSMQKFEVVAAHTLKADGRKVEVKPEAIFTRDLPASTGAPMFADVKVVVVVFAEVAVGDSIYARVRHEQTQPMFPGHYSNLFSMAPHFAVDQNRIVLRAPAGMRLRIENEGYEQKTSSAGGVTTFEWSTSNATIAPVESGSVAPLDYSKRLSISTFGDFSEFAKAYAGRAADKAAATPAIRKLADEITAGAADPREQARRLYDWVTQNIRYVGIFLGTGAVVPHSAEQVLANRYGDCKDYVTLFTALLAAKGIEAQTAIVSLGNSYWTSKLPLLPNFNHVIAYIPSLGVWADLTSSVTPFGRLPIAVQGKTAVMVPSGALQTTPPDTAADNVTERTVTLEIGEDGTVTGATLIAARGVRAERYRATARELTPEKIPEYVRNLTSGSQYKGQGTVEFVGTQERHDRMQVRAKYTLSGGIDWPGAGAFGVPAAFRGNEGMATQIRQNAAANTRPRDAGGVETLVENYTIKLPAKMKIVTLPRGVSFKNEVASYESTYRQDGQTILVTRKLVDLYKGPVKQPALFKADEEMSAALARDLRAQIVYQSE